MNRPASDVQAFAAHAADADLDDLRACGPVGSCAEYRHLWRLQELVAYEIEALHRGAAC
ncbi:MAG: hypothetical protein RLO21_08805 [Nitratireductor sp.]